MPLAEMIRTGPFTALIARDPSDVRVNRTSP
jgi:hypothetical protein